MRHMVKILYGVTLSGTTGSTGTVGNGNTGSYKDSYYDAPAASRTMSIMALRMAGAA